MYFVVIIVYFIVMLGIGIYFSKRVKSEEDYFIAKDKLNAATIGFSFSATQMSGSTYLSTPGQIRNIGLGFIPSALSSAAAPWFCYVLTGDRIRKISNRLNSVTMADIFQARFGGAAGLIATVIMLVAAIPIIASQLKAAAGSFEILLNIPYIAGLFIFGGIVVAYTLLGGMFAVAWTDLVQGILMIAGLVLLVPELLAQSGGFIRMHELYAQYNPAGMTLTGIQPAIWVISGFVIWGFFQIGGQPASITRFLTTSKEKTLKRALVYSIFFESIIFVLITIVAFAGGALLPELEAAQSDSMMPMMLQKYMPPVVGGIVLAAALGAMMSTVDSVLLMASSLVVNNIYVKMMGRDPNDKKTLDMGRYATIAIGVLGLLIAVKPPDAILWIITMGFSLMASAFTFPLLFGLWWPKATKAGGVAGIVSGAAGCVFWYVWGFIENQSLSRFIGGIWPALVGAIVSIIVLVLVSMCTKPIDSETAELFYAD